MNRLDRDYLCMMEGILYDGEKRTSRAGTTLGVFGTTANIILTQGFPLLTTKQVKYKLVFAELAGFLSGSRDVQTFRDFGTKIWDYNTNSESWQANPNCLDGDDMGRVYGVQWRDWISVDPTLGEGGDRFKSTDQIKELIDGLNIDPLGRRHLVTAWNPGELDQMCLPPCHYAFQCHLSADFSKLTMLVHMRSVDLFLGMPFNIASYALLAHLIAQTITYDCEATRVMFTFGDTHIYENHVEQCREQLARTPMDSAPRLELDPEATVFNFSPDMASIVGYEHHPAIEAPLN